MMLRFYLVLFAALFLLVSFLFLGGWPFRSASSSEDDVPLSRTVEESPPVSSGRAIDVSSDEEVDQEVPVAAPPEEEPAAADVGDEVADARRLIEQGREAGPASHRRALTDAILNSRLPKGFRHSRLNELRALNAKDVFGPNPSYPLKREQIRGGDNLTRIARRVKKAHGNNVTPTLIAKLNGMRSSMIRAGRSLRVPTDSISVFVQKDDYRLYILLGGTIILDYPVGLGRNDSTPEGDFVIEGKTKNPTWTMPDGKVVPYGDPEHIIGSRWMGFATEYGRTSYGIHGTVDDSTIGRQMSDGCIRLVKADVEEIYDIVPEGCRVSVAR